MTVYKCIKRDERYSPARNILVHEAKTEAGAINWLENNGGGIYRNILHNFDCVIKGKA